MSGYTKFSEYGTFKGCGRLVDARVMNPLMTGKVFTNPYKIPNNGMRVFTPSQTTALNYEQFSSAYPQAKIC